MSNKIRALAVFCLLTAIIPATQAKESVPSTVNPGVTVAELARQQPIHWVSIEQIEQSLADSPPMSVGFDIDDTLLFSSPGFVRGKREFSPNSDDYLNDPAFWEKMNNGWDAFSMPKEVAKHLLALHLKRGDQIYFVTGRTPTKTESVTKILQEDFMIPDEAINPVIFAGDEHERNTKTQWLKENNIKIFYGDSDNDITAAQQAGARGIRLLRASNSSYLPLPKAGSLGEEVIVNSDY